jgi:hypothetical protein
MGPNDRRAIEDYLKADADDDQRKALMSSLGSLDIGEAWLWEPGGDPPLFDKVRIRQRNTFNSSATPKPGQRRVEPSKFADVDLEAVKGEMAAAIERATADDPKALKRRIAELERILTQKTSVPEKVIEYVTETVEVSVPYVPEEIRKAAKTLSVAAQELLAALDVPPKPVPVVKQPSRPSAPVRHERAVTSPSVGPAPDASDVALGKAERAILSVLAQFPGGRTRQQVATLSGYSGKSSGFANSLSRLRTLSLINRGEPIRATAEGLSAIEGQVEPLPTGRGLLHHWNSKLGKAERAILEATIEAWPASLTRDEVAERTGYSPTSSGFANALSKLRTLELIGGRGEIVADETLAQEVRNG